MSNYKELDENSRKALIEEINYFSPAARELIASEFLNIPSIKAALKKDHSEIIKEIQKRETKGGFYSLLAILSMLFYILGSTSYFFFDAIVYPKLHAYIASVSIPLIIIGIAIGILYKPIFIKIFKR